MEATEWLASDDDYDDDEMVVPSEMVGDHSDHTTTSPLPNPVTSEKCEFPLRFNDVNLTNFEEWAGCSRDDAALMKVT